MAHHANLLGIAPEHLDGAPLGDVVALAELVNAAVAQRLTDPNVKGELQRWRKESSAGSAADWNTSLAIPADSDAQEPAQLKAPEDINSTLPAINKSLENSARHMESSRIAAYGLTNRSLIEDHEGLLGIPENKKGSLQTQRYLIDTLQISRREANRRAERAAILLPKYADKSLTSGATEPAAAPEMPHLAKALHESTAQAAERRQRLREDPEAQPEVLPINHYGALDQQTHEELSYGVPLENADLMINYRKKLMNYGQQSKADPVRVEEILVSIEEALLPWARTETHTAFQTILRRNEARIKNLIDEDGPEPLDEGEGDEKELPRSEAHIYPIEGGVGVDMKLYGSDAEYVLTLQHQLQRLTPDKLKDRKRPEDKTKPGPVEAELTGVTKTNEMPLPDEHSADLGREDIVAEAENGEEYTAEDLNLVDDRTPAQILAEGLLNVLLAGIRSGAKKNGIPQNRGTDTTLLALVDYETLLGQLRANTASEHGRSGPPDTGPPAENGQSWHRAEGQYLGEDIPAAQLRAMACDAKIIPVVMNGPSEVLDMGRSQRLYNHAQYSAMIIRDGGCTVPGCTTPGAWCQTHHIKEWSEGGDTDLSNGVLLCQRHHTEVHQGKWQVAKIDSDGVWYRPPTVWIDPNQPLVRNTVWDLIEFDGQGNYPKAS